jgi:outer membrane protein assembly factor BamB
MMTFKVPAAALACVLCLAACGGRVTAPDRPSAPPRAAVSSQAQPPSRATSPAVRASWPQRAILAEDTALQQASQVLDPAAHVLYALVPGASGSSVLQAIDLRTGRVRRGASYPLSGLALAAGYLWVYGQPGSGRPSVRDETSPRTLATIRSLSVPGNDEAAPVVGPAGSVWAGAGRTESPATGVGTVYDWAMGSSAAYAGGALWVTTDGGVVACVNPATGRVRAQETVTSQPVLVAPDPAAGQIVVVGDTGVVTITPPRDCWG